MVQSPTGILALVFAAALVLLMQGGFAALEAGLARPKNAAHVATVKLTTLLLTAAVFWVCGYAFLLGPSAGGLIGRSGFFLGGSEAGAAARFCMHLVFAATAANLF